MASIPTQEEVLTATRKSQEAMMAAVKNWLETVRTATPKLTSVYTLTDKLPKLSDVGLPFADKLPTPQDAVASAYHLAEQLLASQRKFAEELVKVTAPLRPGYRGNSAEVPSRKAWQEAVTDSAPKTPVASTPPKAVASAPPAKAPVASAPPAKAPVASTPPAKAPVASTPPATPAASAPPKAPVASTPATTAVASTPAKAPAASAPAKARVASAPAKAAPARPAAKSTTAKSAPKSAAAGSARKSAGTKTATPKGTDAS